MADPLLLLTTLITDRQLCLTCLSTTANMKTDAVERVIDVLSRELVLHREADVCDGCDARRIVFRTDRVHVRRA